MELHPRATAVSAPGAGSSGAAAAPRCALPWPSGDHRSPRSSSCPRWCPGRSQLGFQEGRQPGELPVLEREPAVTTHRLGRGARATKGLLGKRQRYFPNDPTLDLMILHVLRN